MWSYAVTTTTATAVKRYQLMYPTRSKQTVHKHKKDCLKGKEATNKEVTFLKSRKHGEAKLLSEDIMAKTIQTVKAFRLKDGPVSSAVNNARAKSVVVVMAEDQCLLTEHGGDLVLSNQWAKNKLNELLWTI